MSNADDSRFFPPFKIPPLIFRNVISNAREQERKFLEESDTDVERREKACKPRGWGWGKTEWKLVETSLEWKQRYVSHVEFTETGLSKKVTVSRRRWRDYFRALFKEFARLDCRRFFRARIPCGAIPRGATNERLQIVSRESNFTITWCIFFPDGNSVFRVEEKESEDSLFRKFQKREKIIPSIRSDDLDRVPGRRVTRGLHLDLEEHRPS